jgi:endonuclease/exonuclease/phosphatase family metal-dependent hydrolase
MGNIRPPDIDVSVPSNVLHVRLARLEILGLRIPDYSRRLALRRECWSWIHKVAEEMLHGPSVIIGDFNTDPAYPPAKCGDCILALVASGWIWAEASGWSYTSPTGAVRRLDHAFVSPHLRVTGAEYVRSTQSDHAALVINIVI